MRSSFIIQLAQEYLRYTRSALGQPHGRPIGLFALILTAVCCLTIRLFKLRSLAIKYS
jgi:hypothetical protein